MIDTIIFDVGQVLINFGWEERFAQLGYDPETCRQLEQALFKNPLWGEFDRSALTDDELVERFIEGAPHLADEIKEIVYHPELLISPRAYTLNWVKDLKDRGYRIYILSNFGKSGYERGQDTLNFLPLVDGALFSFECKLVKPEPEIYQLLLDKFSIQADEAVFIDDTMINLKAAEKFGIHTLHFTTYEETVARLEALLGK